MITAYSRDAKATCAKHIRNQQFIAFNPLLSGLFCIALVITLIMQRKIVTSKLILPGKQFGGMMKLIKLNATMRRVGMKICQTKGDNCRSRQIVQRKPMIADMQRIFFSLV